MMNMRIYNTMRHTFCRTKKYTYDKKNVHMGR